MYLRHHHHRRLLALIALFAMLFQQLAMAAYMCPIETGGAQASMGNTPCHERGAPDGLRCHTHCHPQAASTDHPPTPTVPAAMLPQTTWLRAVSWLPEGLHNAPLRAVTARATAPPITIRHCTFQI